ncbi:hypothetical protein SCHPADRAFT_882487 [Schizopora paradoxa]|uniref:Uncharacterized protein n=1 Tax=Schizopora paradoxa TaxID=27342 RepID=A0A0H2RPJ6_9AGAM|nr:hypothetical protein SCHPADRAFT_882487 [Schizopora paradoxa]
MATKDVSVEPFVYIPYEGPDDEETADASEPSMPTPSDLEDVDLPCGPGVRLDAFERVWEEYNEKLKEVVKEMHAPGVAQAVEEVLDAYTNVSPLLLHTELPVIAISGPDRRGTATICSEIRTSLCSTTAEGDIDEEDAMHVDNSNTPRALISSVGASDCVNLASAMKALIAGFTSNYPIRDEDFAQLRRKGTAGSSLVTYDINLLDAWFAEYKEAAEGQTPPKLVVFINEFEDAEPSVIQDLFYICSLHIPRLPLVFVLALSSPKQPSYLHAVYPRTTLALLQLKRIASSVGSDPLQALLLKVFYDPSYEPPVHLGPATVDFLVEQYTKNSGSIEAIAGLLKLVLLQHFMNPLTAFTVDDFLGEESMEDASQLLSEDTSRPFLRLLVGRLYHPQKSTLLLPKKKRAWPIGGPQDVIETVRGLRRDVLKEARLRRLAFRVFLLVRDFMLRKGFKTASDGKEGIGFLGMMSACLRGGSAAAKEGNLSYLAKMTRKLSKDHLKELLQDLYQLFFNQPRVIREDKADAITPVIAKWMARLDSSGTSSDIAEDLDHTTIGREVGDWLLEFFDELFQAYTETNLWDIWYTGNPVAISELTNPAPRVNVIGALLNPGRYLEHTSSEDHEKQSLPDTSLLFQRYLESGRMLNVHDWYESFAGALEADRSARGSDKPSKETPSRRGRALETTPRRRKGRGRGASPDDPEGSDEEMDDDAWKMEMHVRFLRGVQELDFMGFLKHTKRKAEHVLKTVYEPPEY